MGALGPTADRRLVAFGKRADAQLHAADGVGGGIVVADAFGRERLADTVALRERQIIPGSDDGDAPEGGVVAERRQGRLVVVGQEQGAARLQDGNVTGLSLLDSDDAFGDQQEAGCALGGVVDRVVLRQVDRRGLPVGPVGAELDRAGGDGKEGGIVRGRGGGHRTEQYGGDEGRGGGKTRPAEPVHATGRGAAIVHHRGSPPIGGAPASAGAQTYLSIVLMRNFEGIIAHVLRLRKCGTRRPADCHGARRDRPSQRPAFSQHQPI